MYGSEHNDSMYGDGSNIGFSTNRSGGVQGGISNGETIQFSVSFKPVSSINLPQSVATEAGGTESFVPQKGRHDPTVLPRAVPLVEAMANLVLVERVLRQSISKSFAGPRSDFSLVDP
jgi:chorismate synthase